MILLGSALEIFFIQIFELRVHILKAFCETGQIYGIPFTVHNSTMKELFSFSDLGESERVVSCFCETSFLHSV